jgi:hypothetical protein
MVQAKTFAVQSERLAVREKLLLLSLLSGTAIADSQK